MTKQPRLTQKELSEACGVPEGTIASLEAHKSNNPRSHVVDPIVAHYGYASAEDMINDYRVSVFGAPADLPIPARSLGGQPLSTDVTHEVVEVPVRISASAGRGSGSLIPGETVLIPSAFAGRHSVMAVRIRGECMHPKLLPGDTAIFQKVADDEVQNGDLVCITLLDEEEDGAYLVKYLQWARNGQDNVILTAEDGTVIVAPYDRVVIEGRFLMMIRS